MPNPNLNDESIEGIVRAIVREEFRNIVNAHTQEIASGVMSKSEAGRLGGLSRRRRGGRKAANKGAVTNPSTDRRLKRNREATA